MKMYEDYIPVYDKVRDYHIYKILTKYPDIEVSFTKLRIYEENDEPNFEYDFQCSDETLKENYLFIEFVTEMFIDIISEIGPEKIIDSIYGEKDEN